jgi:hypothetical protein
MIITAWEHAWEPRIGGSEERNGDGIGADGDAYDEEKLQDPK